MKSLEPKSTHSGAGVRRLRSKALPLVVCPIAFALVTVTGYPSDTPLRRVDRDQMPRIDAPMQQYVLVAEDRLLTIDGSVRADSLIVGPETEDPGEFDFDDLGFGAGATAVLDLNGDGIDDLAVVVKGFNRPYGLGEPILQEELPQTSSSRQYSYAPEGGVFVFFGNEPNDPRFRDSQGQVDASSWGPADVIIVGGYLGDRLGAGGLVVGDFNGDGYDDLAVATPYSAGVPYARHQAGSAYIVFGGPGGVLAEHIYTADEEPGNGLSRIASGGVIVDTRGEGIDIVPFGTSSQRDFNGIPVVFPDVTIFADPDASGDSFLGFSQHEAMRVLDFNGDGVDDLAIGAAFIDGVETAYAGGVYVLFGSDTSQVVPLSRQARNLGLGGTIDLAEGVPGVLIVGTEAFGALSWRNQMAVGDFDGDGIADLLIGAPYGDTSFPSAHIVFGNEEYFSGQVIETTTEGDFAGTRIVGRTVDGEFSQSIHVYATNESMDYNGDGIDDPVLYNPNSGRQDLGAVASDGEGVVFVVEGDASLRGATIELDVFSDFSGDYPMSVLSDERILLAVVGAEPNAGVGSGVIVHGDFNGDGRDDLVVGVPGNISQGTTSIQSPGVALITGRSNVGRIVEAGESLVGYGPTFLPDTFIREPQDIFSQNGGIAATGAVVGDFNGDGYEELVLASNNAGFVEVELIPRQTNIQNFEGITFVIYGQPTPMPAVIDLEDLTNEAPEPDISVWYGQLGDGLNQGRRLDVIDFYQDGIDDLVLFSYRADPDLPGIGVRSDAGVAHILSGDNDLPPVSPGAVVRTNHADDPLAKSHRTARAVVDFARGNSNSFTTVLLHRDSSFVEGAEPIANPVWQILTDRFPESNGLPGPNGTITFKYLNREIHPDQEEPNLTVLFGPTPSGPWTAISALPRKQVHKDLNLLQVYFPTPLVAPDKPFDGPETPTILRPVESPEDAVRRQPNQEDLAQVSSSRQSNLVGYFIIGDPGNILAVDLVSFTATTDGIGHPVVLDWETGLELDNAGFYIVRASQVNGEWSGGEPVTPFLIGAKGAASTYTFTDTRPMAGGETRAYLLLDVDVSGKRTAHGPAIVVVPEAAASVRDWSLY